MRRSNSRGAKLRSPHLLGQVHSDLEAPGHRSDKYLAGLFYFRKAIWTFETSCIR